MPFKVSPHTHPESPLTGSTIANMIARAKDLGREYFSHTDQGHLSSVLKSYNLSKKAGLKFIPGIEIFFKDSRCPIISGTVADKCKYFTLTVYTQDQEAYQELCKIVSDTHFATIEIRGETQSLWTWKELERISKFNTNIVLTGVHCMVSKPMLAGNAKLGDMVLNKLISLFPNRVFPALLAEPWGKRWANVIEIEYEDGTKDSVLSTDVVTTDRARRIKAIDLINRPGHSILYSKTVANTHYEIDKKIKKMSLHRGFLPLPGGDISLKTNRFLKALAAKNNLKLLVSDYSFYANKEDKIVQTMRLEGNDKLHQNLHMKTTQEIEQYLSSVVGLDSESISQILKNNNNWASLFDNFSLKYDLRLSKVDGSPIKKVMDVISQRGRMDWNNPQYVARLKEEIDVICKNPKRDLSAYFLPIADIINYCSDNGCLTGPSRGSAGGSMLCYLMGITQINPLKYDLSFPRFLSVDRLANGDIPDVDSDFSSRELLVGSDGKSGYLYSKYGDMLAQISTRHTLRLKSTIKDTNRYFKGAVEDEIERLCKSLPEPPQGIKDLHFVFGYENDGEHVPGLLDISEDLKKYVAKRPEEWNIVSRAMSLNRSYSRHASAFLIADVPIKEVVPTKEGNITQYEAKECEAAGLVKVDLLVVNQLKDIEVCLGLINKKNSEDNKIGYFTHNGAKSYIWDLPEEPEVFKSVWNGETETIFQINTKSMIPFVKDIMPGSIEDLSTILALVRPGPLDYIDPDTGRTMAEEYVQRRHGKSEPNLKEMHDLIPETYGVLCFQEQSLKISKELGGMSAQDAEKLRRIFSKKLKAEALQMKPVFMSTAVDKIGAEKAEIIWNMMESASRYSFNKSHSIAYAHISYACMFLKHHYPLEWWAAILTNASEQEITGKLWPYVKDILFPPDINLSGDSMVVDYKNNKIRAKLGVIRGMGEASIEPIVSGRPYGDIHDFINKDVAGPSLTRKLIHVGVLDSLFPAKANFIEKLKIYEDAVEVKKFTDKVKKAETDGKKVRATQPKEGVLPEEYLNLHPLKEAAMKKSVLPSLPIDLHALGKKYSKVIAPYQSKPSVTSFSGHSTLLVNGEMLGRLNDVPGESITKDVYIASTCFIVKTEEFSYPKNSPTKKALKVIIDADGHISEHVLWPDYNSGELLYPKELKKGCIGTIFFKKKAGRKDLTITDIVVETT